MVAVISTTRHAGDAFAVFLQRTLVEQRERGTPCDLVIVDPVFAFVGADVMQAREVSHFLRESLAPIIKRERGGLILVHHANKPPRENTNWQGGDYAYLGAGSAEWTNWARFVITLMPTPVQGIFKLQVPKRSNQLRWRDAAGQPTAERLICHSENSICWREAESQGNLLSLMGQSSRARSRAPEGPSLEELLVKAKVIAGQKVRRKSELKAELAKELGCSYNRIQQNLLPAIRESEDLLESRVNRGTTPIYLIGPKDLVTQEVEKLKREQEPSADSDAEPTTTTPMPIEQQRA